jgi:hypothetical protein
VKTADWSNEVAPFWTEVIRSALTTKVRPRRRACTCEHRTRAAGHRCRMRGIRALCWRKPVRSCCSGGARHFPARWAVGWPPRGMQQPPSPPPAAWPLQGIAGLFKAGWTTIKGALVMPLMAQVRCGAV